MREAVDSAKTTLSALKGHLESLKDIGDVDKVGKVGASQQGKAADDGALRKVYDALKGIVEIAGKEGIEKLKESNLTLNKTLNR